MEATQNDENSLSQSQSQPQPQTLSKNAKKKLLKQQRYEAKKAEKKAHRGSVRQILLPFYQQLPDLILVPDSIHDWREGDLALNPGVASEKHNVLQDFHFPCPYLSLSLSLTLCLVAEK